MASATGSFIFAVPVEDVLAPRHAHRAGDVPEALDRARSARARYVSLHSEASHQVRSLTARRGARRVLRRRPRLQLNLREVLWHSSPMRSALVIGLVLHVGLLGCASAPGVESPTPSTANEPRHPASTAASSPTEVAVEGRRLVSTCGGASGASEQAHRRWKVPAPSYVTPPRAVPVTPGDPHHGSFSLDEALPRHVGDGDKIVATISTSLGVLSCDLFYDRAPITVANFVGLATGRRAWRDPTGQWVNTPIYNGGSFHRVIAGFMIQGGDPTGTGSYDAGYVIPDEIWVGAAHDREGLLCMANRGADTGGTQFFITDAATPHLDKMSSYTVFGACEPTSVVHAIATTPAISSRPTTPVTIHSVTINVGR
ncbi:MAG: peptidylprolyl isomerase [Polyangiaceae bacterium]